MAKSQESFNKKEKEKKRLKKRKDKEARAEERRNNPSGGFESMLAYVDEYGNITDTPPDPTRRSTISADTIEVSTPKKEATEADALRSGVGDFYNDAKGFGFIKEKDTREKYFFHVQGILETVKEGDAVLFELERGLRGMNAIRVKKGVPPAPDQNL